MHQDFIYHPLSFLEEKEDDDDEGKRIRPYLPLSHTLASNSTAEKSFALKTGLPQHNDEN